MEVDWVADEVGVPDLGDDGVAGHVPTGAVDEAVLGQLQVVGHRARAVRPQLGGLVEVGAPTEGGLGSVLLTY